MTRIRISTTALSFLLVLIAAAVVPVLPGLGDQASALPSPQAEAFRAADFVIDKAVYYSKWQTLGIVGTSRAATEITVLDADSGRVLSAANRVKGGSWMVVVFDLEQRAAPSRVQIVTAEGGRSVQQVQGVRLTGR